MISFIATPVPTLTVYNIEYTGISILEKLEIILTNPNEYQDLDLKLVTKLFKKIALWKQQYNIPFLGFELRDMRSVLPTKRIIDVGYDLTIIDVYKKISNKITMFETGVAIDIPLGYYVELIPRSSLSKSGYMLANSVGIIDPSYTGTVKVPLIKIDDTIDDLELPSCVAQLILKPYVFSYSKEVQSIGETSRGENGFGSTTEQKKLTASESKAIAKGSIYN